jgi:hypothetical protein
LLKVDKETRGRIILPSLFFLRRLIVAIILVLSTQHWVNTSLQYVIIVTLSAIKLIYLMTSEPYHTRDMNVYVMTMELIYFLLGISAFMFTDATADVDSKVSLGYIVLGLLCLFLLVSLRKSGQYAREGQD